MSEKGSVLVGESRRTFFSCQEKLLMELLLTREALVKGIIGEFTDFEYDSAEN